METFLWIIFIIFVLENTFLVYKFFINKPLKQQLAEETAKRKTAEAVINVIKKKIPRSKSGRLALLNKLANSSNE